MTNDKSIRAAIRQSIADLEVAVGFLREAGTDPEAWIDGVIRRLREAVQSPAEGVSPQPDAAVRAENERTDRQAQADPWATVEKRAGYFDSYLVDAIRSARAADAAQIAALRAERDAAQQETQTLRDALTQARLQLEYLDGKFPSTGTTAGVLAQIRAALSASPETDEAWMARVYPDHGYVPSEGMTYAQFCRAARATWEQRVGSDKP